uniref:uncharacterized protein LOC120821408 isoform X1 n=1 Tax=Gasterosteus aculeatus aculeatus TaxID=481459 RepID=UPI001A991F52|nr:uncharacterized protein LOC120821408 isoform X1 [Gasterosteus aculeatus aculeatus]
MRPAVEFVTVLILTAGLSACRGDAEGVPPPTDVSYDWLDPITVRVSWQKPIGNFNYKYKLIGGGTDERWTDQTSLRNFTAELLTENMTTGNWKYLIRTVKTCDKGTYESPEVSIIIEFPVPRAEVHDIKCLITRKIGRNCSWIPGNQPLEFFYRTSGISNVNHFRACKLLHSGPTRNGCYLEDVGVADDICLLFKTQTGNSTSTFNIKPMIDPPELSVREGGDELELSWTPLEDFKTCIWEYNVCYNKCNHLVKCLHFTSKEMPMPVAYDNRCRYDFWYSVKTTIYYTPVFSDRSKVVSYGTNEPADETLTVVAIVLPIILSVCIFLSCYCFRRYSFVICPVIPDPSAIFKEMMMSGNKELKTTGTLYAPVPEAIESCRVDPVPKYMLKSSPAHARSEAFRPAGLALSAES